MADEKFSKLPVLAKPHVYNIHLKTDVKNFLCEGRETIDLDIVEETDFLKLHTKETEIKSAKAKLADGTEIDLKVEVDNIWSKLTLNFGKKVKPQRAQVTINFVSKLADVMHGFYRSKYKDQDGKEHYMFSTQFESTYARQAFPCWDEPVYKAKFDIALEVPEELTALSNMNVISEEKSAANGMKVVKYATTPLMSSYLVAFAVGEFEYIETKDKNGCIIRVYTVPGKKSQGEFALECARKALEFHAEWFGIPYPLPKCDLIAIPDFSMGAMENWGLVTYREVVLLVDPAKSSTQGKRFVALVIGHELAHFWFGNLVTMKWWTDLWLKEGFASFCEYLFVGACYPEMKIWLHYVNDELASGFSLDALRSSHPIEVEIGNPNELDEIYDNITYSKSNSVNRMLCNFLGEKTFQEGLRLYLNKFQYSNAETVDLWEALSKASGQDVTKMMSTWTKQMGFPLVRVEQKVDGDKRTFKLKQERFIADGGKDELNSIWHVPLGISTASNPTEPKFKHLLTKPEDEWVIEGVKPDEWVKFNAGTTGFYRVQYADDLFQSLLPAIEKKTLPVLDRYGIANDYHALMEAGKINAQQFLNFFKACANEDDYIVWCAVDQGVASLLNVINRHDEPTLRKRFDQFVCKVIEPLGQRLGWKPAQGEDTQTGLLRALILNRLSRCGHQPTIDQAAAIFKDHVDNKTELVADLRAMIYASVGRNHGEEGTSALKKIFETSGFGEVERHCIAAMAQATDRDVISKTFDYGIREGFIRAQDLHTLFRAACTTKTGQDFIWQYFKANQKLLQQKFGSPTNSMYLHCFKCAADHQASEAVANEVESFCKANYDPDTLKSLDRPMRQVVESIRLNEQLLKRNGTVVKDFLSQQGF